ncbi:MAG: VanW family protein [Negativicutes bacterium]
MPKRPEKVFIKKTISTFIIILLFASILLFAANYRFMVSDHIYEGVYVGEIPVGGLSPEAAAAKISIDFQARTSQPLKIIYQDQQWPIAPNKINLTIDASALAQKAHQVGRTGNLFFRMKQRYLSLNQNITIPLSPSLDKELLQSILVKLAKTVDREPQNATFRFRGSSVVITPEQIGRKTNIPRALKEISDKLSTNFSFTYQLPVDAVAPDIAAKDYEGIDGVIASYTTQFSTVDANRTQNIMIASNELNGTLVRSGSTFSFNSVIGPRLAQHGYKQAPVFIGGKLVPDWGGGVCQVSTTLYNAALLADMSITERTSHFSPPGYVPLGHDATVADNQLDFKFVNNSPTSIYIISRVSGGQITVQILGKRDDNAPDIIIVATDKKEIEYNVVKKQDPEIELGKEVIEDPGHKGFLVTTYRVKTRNGQEISREFLAADEFPPADKIIKVGTKIPSPVPLPAVKPIK